MKKISYLFLSALAIVALQSCANEDNFGDSGYDNDVVAAQTAIRSYINGAGGLNETPADAPDVERIAYHWDNSVDVFEHFPEFKTPEGCYDNFLYVSNGEPFDLVMLYSNGGYRHYMGIYWYDADGNCHEQQLWSEWDDLKGGDKVWVNANGSVTDKISRQSDEAGAYKIQLPAGTKFGFYVHSLNGNKEEIKEAVREPMPFGPLVTHVYKFYTEQEKNWNYPVAVYDKYAENGRLSSQAMTTSIDGWTLVGFEDISITYPSCDFDYNDCVFAINPAQHIDGTPQTERVEGSVETNLSVAPKDSYDQVKLSVHVRANTDVEIVLPIANEALADDFAIVAKHDIEYAYSEPITIADQTVELLYSITKEGYLKIQTKGINQAVLDYCNNTYADGLTFECNLGFGKFDLEGTPTIAFTNEPYVYKTSCVNNSTEATDVEVVWADGSLIHANPAVGPVHDLTYTHRYYSTYSLTELQGMGWLKNVEK